MKQFAETGNRVIAACRSPDIVQRKLEALGNDVHITQLDISNPASVQSWAESVKGIVNHVDVVVNNAGIYGPRVSLDEMTAEGLIDVFKTNTVGQFLVVQQLRRGGVLGGHEPSLIANVTSKMGSIDDNGSGGSYAYRASKAALNIINKSFSIDLAKENIRSVLLHPGYVMTDMNGGYGYIDCETSVSGMIRVLESNKDLQGTWYAFDGKEIPW